MVHFNNRNKFQLLNFVIGAFYNWFKYPIKKYVTVKEIFFSLKSQEDQKSISYNYGRCLKRNLKAII